MTLALLALASVFFICVAMTKITEHTSFDGRPDRFSCLVDGRLRWESDTNLDGHVDQIDDFDADGYRTRTVRDTDHDGIADLLVLYRDGAPVYTTRASTSALAASPPSQHGNSLNDPFARETRVVEKVKKLDPLAGLLLGSHLSGAAPCRQLQVESGVSKIREENARVTYQRHSGRTATTKAGAEMARTPRLPRVDRIAQLPGDPADGIRHQGLEQRFD